MQENQAGSRMLSSEKHSGTPGDGLPVNYYLCTSSHAYGVPGAATVLVAAIHTTAEFSPGSIPQPIHVVDTNLNNGAVFCSLLASPKSASLSVSGKCRTSFLALCRKAGRLDDQGMLKVKRNLGVTG
jgi:hypothetical protein